MIVALVLPVGFALYGIFDGITLNYTVEISSIQASSLPALNGATTSLTPSFNLTVRVYNHFRHHICFTNWEASVFYDGIPLGRGSSLTTSAPKAWPHGWRRPPCQVNWWGWRRKCRLAWVRNWTYCLIGERARARGRHEALHPPVQWGWAYVAAVLREIGRSAWTVPLPGWRLPFSLEL